MGGTGVGTRNSRAGPDETGLAPVSPGSAVISQ